ncbi:hypothetical protein [Cellulophaga sp. BC115SP]|uniref:hypothetical protein n=1 Tax=Cellulophaga sp. BC115SP TaxID=2683263 RepID=UPI001412B22C|nr:hypothetical protein [Cellulophaga sp. BC115SP]NBB29876.1 hypothetical protein [Cellulophaga sp. BC115SP]
MSYKYQIEQALLSKNWDIVEIGFSEEWWDDENWKIQYRFNSSICFYLCFIINPMFDGNRKKGQGIIYEIKASTKFPQNWNDDTNTIAAIEMSKRKFDLKLKEFIDILENYKKVIS